MTTPAIKAIGLTKRFRRQGGEILTAVDGIDLTIGSGEIVAFLGPNGAGKTTTVDMFLGLTSPPDFTVRETIRAIAALHGRPERVDVVVERAGLGPLANRLVKACSGGEQQRLRFAVALVPDPDLVPVAVGEPGDVADISQDPGRPGRARHRGSPSTSSHARPRRP